MLNTMISMNHNIDINKYAKLKTSIKNFSKKSKVLSWSQFKKFINEAPNYIHLTTKVIAIFGVSGAMRSQEICDLAVQDVEDTGTQLMVTVLKTKSTYPQTFMIGPEFHEKIRQYQTLRPKDKNRQIFLTISSRCMQTSSHGEKLDCSSS